MLDQNTDRMWYVIGALVVGAGIILLANGALPDIFASVTGTFEESVGKAITVADDIGSYDANLLRVAFEHKYTFANGLNGNVGTTANVDGEIVRTHDTMFEKMHVTPGNTYIFYSPEGLYNASIAYYDASDNYVGGYRIPGKSNIYVTAVAPESARYARVSARDGELPIIEGSSVQPEWSSPTDTWVFKQIEPGELPEEVEGQMSE